MVYSHNIPLVLLFLLGLFGLVLALGIYLRRTRLGGFLGPPTIAFCLGIAFSAIVVYGGSTSEYKKVLSFNPDIFLYVMLPTIIIDASLNVNVHLFLLNFGTIVSSAIVGTSVATFIIGVMQWAFGQANIAYSMPFLYNLLLGSIISATDPVSVLAVFQQLEADGNLFINVFGESVLNDAVAQVLYETVSEFLPYEGHEAVPVNAREVWRAIGKFFGIFLGSVVMGIACGMVIAIIMRTGHFKTEGSALETGMVVIFLYASYFAATVADISGIVSVLFCGLVVRAYVWPNISSEARLLIHSTFELLAGLLDIFLFAYIGVTVFTLDHLNIWRYTALCLISVGAARFAGLIPSAGIPSLFRPKHRRLGWKALFLIWWSGLRGAMAFALSNLAAGKFGEQGEVIRACVFYVAFLTVVFNGGSVGWLLKKLKLTEADRLAGLAKHPHPRQSNGSGHVPSATCILHQDANEGDQDKGPFQHPSASPLSIRYCPWEIEQQIHPKQDPFQDKPKPWEDGPVHDLHSLPTGRHLYTHSMPMLSAWRHHLQQQLIQSIKVFKIEARSQPVDVEHGFPSIRPEANFKPPWSRLYAKSRPLARQSWPALQTISAPNDFRSRALHEQPMPLDHHINENPRRMRVEYQRRQEAYQFPLNSDEDEETQPTLSGTKAKSRSFLEWLQSHNSLFYDTMMAIDRNFLSKYLIPPDVLEHKDNHGHPPATH